MSSGFKCESPEIPCVMSVRRVRRGVSCWRTRQDAVQSLPPGSCPGGVGRVGRGGRHTLTRSAARPDLGPLFAAQARRAGEVNYGAVAPVACHMRFPWNETGFDDSAHPYAIVIRSLGSMVWELSYATRAGCYSASIRNVGAHDGALARRAAHHLRRPAGLRPGGRNRHSRPIYDPAAGAEPAARLRRGVHGWRADTRSTAGSTRCWTLPGSI